MFARIATCSLLMLVLAAGSTLAAQHGAWSQGLDDMGSTAGGQTPSGSNDSRQTTPQPTSNFNASNYKSGADCLNAATAAHAPLSACANLK